MIHKMRLNEVPFERISSGDKTIELRLYDEKRRMIKPGDVIEFESRECPGKYIAATVKSLHIFKDFKELYRFIPLDKCGYSSDEIPAASPDDMLLYYPEEEQKKYGVVGIEIELLKTENEKNGGQIMKSESTDFIFDCTAAERSDIPESFIEYCDRAVLTVKDDDTFMLLTPEEFEKLIDRISKSKHRTFLMRFIAGEALQVGSFEGLPEALMICAERFWGQKCPLFHFTFKDGIYLITKENG